MKDKQPLERVLFIGCLIIAGEAVFSLPFHVARFFRPTVLQVFVALVGGRWLLDRSPGVTGHQHFFLFLCVFATIGLVASWRFRSAQSSSP